MGATIGWMNFSNRTLHTLSPHHHSPHIDAIIFSGISLNASSCLAVSYHHHRFKISFDVVSAHPRGRNPYRDYISSPLVVSLSIGCYTHTLWMYTLCKIDHEGVNPCDHTR